MGQEPHFEGIVALHAAGIVRGCEPDPYCPAAPVLRGQTATIIARTLGLDSPPGPALYSDIAGTAHEAGIRRVAAAGISRGHTDGTYRPGAPVTRGQASMLLVDAFLDQP